MAAPIRFLTGRQQQQKIGILGSTEDQKVLEVIGRVGIGTTIFDPSYQLDVRGDAFIRDGLTVDSITITGAGNNFSGITTFTDTTDNVLGNVDTGAVQIDGGLGVEKNTTVGAALSVNQTAYIVGVSTFRDRVIFDSTNSIQIPVGTTAERDIVGVAVTGQIRYNTQLSSFEGYGPGGYWGSLGGVKDVNQDTYIIPELSAGSNEDTLYFYTGGYLSGTISSTTGADLNVNLNVDGHIETDTLNVSGFSTFASNLDVNASIDVSTNLTVDGLSDLDELNVAGIATFGSNLDVNASVDILNNLTVDGLSDLDELNVAGIATFGSNLDVNASIDVSTNLTVDGLSDLDELNVAGLSTFASNLDVNASVDILNNLTVDGLSDLDELNVAGIATFGSNLDVNASIDVSTNLNVSGVSTLGTVKISSGIVTATTGVVTYYGDGRYLDLTDSVALGGDTTGDYVQSITGTSNQITVTGGTGESSTPTLSIPNQFTAPQDVTIERDLLVKRDVTINGNITIGGTSATLFTSQLQVEDADIILGIRTDGLGNDISTDNTANHGGIAIASTEGNPLVDLYVAGIETVPTTYKKIMWFKAGTFAGLGTDAWLSNYAVGIGTTQFPTGTRLAAGNNFKVYDNIVNVGNGITMYANTGIISATAYYGSGGNLEDILKEKIEGITAKLVDADANETTLGNPLSVAFLTINNDNATVGYITAVGFGSTAIYYFNDPIARGLTTDASINTTGIVTFQSDVNVGLGATLAFFDISTGKVGINSTIPQKTLDVIGDVKLSGKLYDHTVSAGSTDYVITSNGETSEWEWKAISSLGVAANIDVQEIGASDTRYLSGVTGTGLTTKVFIDTNNPVVINGSGDVGIGTDTITAKLTVDVGTAVTAFVIDGSEGQLFSVTNNLTSGSIFSVNDVYGVPSIDVDADGTIQLAPFGATEYVGIGKTNPTEKLDVIGNVQVGQASTTSTDWSILRINKAEGSGIVDFTDEGAGITTTTNPQYLVGRKWNERRDSLAIWRFVGNGNGGVGGHLGSDALFQPSGNLYLSNNLGIGTTVPTQKLDVAGNIAINQTTVVGSATASLSTLTQTAIHTGLSTSTYRSVEYTIQAKEGTNFHATKILALHNGTTAYHNEYGTIFNNSSVATFDIDVSGGNLRLLATGASASQTDYVINFVATKV